jgi:hypothetical protein
MFNIRRQRVNCSLSLSRPLSCPVAARFSRHCRTPVTGREPAGTEPATAVQTLRELPRLASRHGTGKIYHHSASLFRNGSCFLLWSDDGRKALPAARNRSGIECIPEGW